MQVPKLCRLLKANVHKDNNCKFINSLCHFHINQWCTSFWQPFCSWCLCGKFCSLDVNNNNNKDDSQSAQSPLGSMCFTTALHKSGQQQQQQQQSMQRQPITAQQPTTMIMFQRIFWSLQCTLTLYLNSLFYKFPLCRISQL